MTRKKKWWLIVAGFLLAVFALELVRERIVYLSATRRLEANYWRVKRGMTKEQVKGILGEPEVTMKEAPEEFWYWFARNHRGALWSLLRLSAPQGHYELMVTFDEQGAVTDVYGGLE